MRQRKARFTGHSKTITAVGTFVAVLTFLPPVGVPADETKPLFEQVDALERFPADARAALGDKLVPFYGSEGNANQKVGGGAAIVIPKTRLLVQLFPDPQAAQRTGVVVRDLDTLRIVRTVQLNSALQRTSSDSFGGGDWAHALDEAGTRLWLLTTSDAAVVEVNLQTLAVTRRPLFTGMAGMGVVFKVGGMTYDRFADDLLVLYNGPRSGTVANVNTLLQRLDVSVPAPASFDPADTAKLYRFRSCTAPVTSADVSSDTFNWDILVTKEFLYVPCQRAGHTVIIVRTARPDGVDDATHPEDVTAGPVYGDAVLADQGSGRLFVTTYRREIWVFETATMSFVGVVATGPDNTHDKTGYGLDTETGRVFFQSRTFGLGVAEGRFFPIPQARTMPRPVTGQERIWSDARTSRVFVLEGDTLTKAAAYRVYRVPPAPTPPTAPDPDRNTVDREEKAGVAEARYNASASGYGSRVLLAKGIAGVPPQPVLGTEAPVAKELATRPTLKPCDFTDRDVFAGRVAKAEYDTGSTAAKAVAVAVDGNTEQDLNQPERCNASLKGLGEVTKWDHTAAECASNQDFVPKEPSQGGHKTRPDLGPSTTTCRAPGEPLEAHAESRFTGGIVEVERSWTKTRVERTSAGVVSTVEAVAEGISVGELHIGEVRSKATSTSNGRPRRADMSTHEITVADVRFGTTVVCESVCDDPVQLEETLNLLSGGRAVFRTGTGDNSGRDEGLVTGSPRGAQTAVQKSTARQASDRALIGDFTVELPAFEVTVFNDNTNWGRARQLYQFAGVASAATYNVVVNPTRTGLDDLGDGLAEESGVLEAAGTPFENLIEELNVSSDPRVARTVASASASASASDVDDGGGGLAGVLRAVARGLRLFLTNPRTALLLLTAWALLGSPAVLSRRRRLLDGIRSV